MFVLFAALPLIVGAFLALGARNSRYPKYIALGAAIASFLVAALIAIGPVQLQSFGWISAHGYQIALTFSLQPLNKLLLLLVAGVAPLIFGYSIGYMNLPSEQNRFYFEMCIFTASMMVFAVSGSLLTMLFAWEMLGIMSYLLIGFWHRKDMPPKAARRAITTIFIGDTAFLGAVAILLFTYHTTVFTTLLVLGQPSAPLSAALLLLLVAAFTKSAQFPFEEWLSDAMAGPTPVSALLHSSTMVKAGVFLVALLLPLYAMAGLLDVILAIGIVSALIGVMNALSERNIKKILAYSTIEDLALMFIALGFGSLYAAMLLFTVQTFYKALLFMGAGSIIKANDGEEEIYSMFNSRSSLAVFIPLLIGVIALAGIFPLGGFFGKTAVAGPVGSIYIYALLLVFDVLSSIYAFRFLFIPARKNPVGGVPSTNYRAIPRAMTVSAAVMAGIVAISGMSFLLLRGVGGISGPLLPGSLDSGMETVAVAGGFAVAYLVYSKSKGPALSDGSVKYRLLHNSGLVNALYRYIALLVLSVGRLVDEFDGVLDRTLSSGGHGIVKLGSILGKVEDGNVNLYTVVFVAGIIVLVLLFGFEFFGAL